MEKNQLVNCRIHKYSSAVSLNVNTKLFWTAVWKLKIIFVLTVWRTALLRTKQVKFFTEVTIVVLLLLLVIEHWIPSRWGLTSKLLQSPWFLSWILFLEGSPKGENKAAQECATKQLFISCLFSDKTVVWILSCASLRWLKWVCLQTSK